MVATKRAPARKPATKVEQSTWVRIDFRKTEGHEEFIEGPPEQMSLEDQERMLNINDVLGWEKYRVVPIDEATYRQHIDGMAGRFRPSRA